MKGTPAPEQINQPFQFNYNDNFDTDWLENNCPVYLKERLMTSLEYIEKTGGQKKESVSDDMPF
jgi:hypothetical protein